jgi:hypothetical protein
MRKNISILCLLLIILLSATVKAQPIVKTHIETGDIEGVITLPNADKIHFVDSFNFSIFHYSDNR